MFAFHMIGKPALLLYGRCNALEHDPETAQFVSTPEHDSLTVFQLCFNALFYLYYLIEVQKGSQLVAALPSFLRLDSVTLLAL